MANLKIPPEKAIFLLNERIDAITALSQKQCDPGYYDILGWCSKTWSVVDEIFGNGDYHSEEIRLIGVTPCSCGKPGATSMQLEIYQFQLLKYIDEIRAGMQAK